MTGLLQVAAGAAILAISLFPCGECFKGTTSDSASLWTLPITLTQTREQKTFQEIPCSVLQLRGPLPPSESVKLTGAGWSGGPLELLISQQGGSQVEEPGGVDHGMPLYSLRINPPAENGEEDNPDAGKTMLMEFPGSSTEDVTSKSVSLPIYSPEHGFMFICQTDSEGQQLICQVSGYNNKQEGSAGTWDTTELVFPLRSGVHNLRFSLTGQDVESQKVYGTPGVQFSTEDSSLGCRAEGAPADLTSQFRTVDAESFQHEKAVLPEDLNFHAETVDPGSREHEGGSLSDEGYAASPAAQEA